MPVREVAVGEDGVPTTIEVPNDELGFGILAAVIALLVLVVFVAVVVLIVMAAVKRYRAAKAAGLDPFAGDIQVLGALAHSAALAPDRPVADRLAEIERLYQQRQITETERDAARARILGTL
jgi:hypothetical protein